MREKKKLCKKWLYVFLLCILMSACTNDQEFEMEKEGGLIALNLFAETNFEEATKSVDVNSYADIKKYTVKILKGEQEVQSFLYSEAPKFINLSNGPYRLRAFYGEDLPASTTGMYVEGVASFNVNSDQSEVSVVCKPVCGRIKIVFDPTMATYFKEYNISLTTKALAANPFVWEKNMTDPVYLRVVENEAVSAKINLTAIDGKKAVVPDKKYMLSPLKSLTIKVKPILQNGNVGITIEIDDKTNDIPVDIEIPSDWK